MFVEDVAQFDFLTFIRAILTEERSCAPEIFYIDFNVFYLILPESRDLLGFYPKSAILCF